MRVNCVPLIVSVLAALLLGAICTAQVSSPTTGALPGCAALAPGASLSVLESRGDLLRIHKAYPEALTCYEMAIARDRNNAVLLNKAGIAKLQMSELEDARRYFEKSIKKNRKYAEPYNNLGVVSYMQGDYKKAIKQYQKALTMEDTSASFHSNLGTAFFAQKKTDKAIAEYSRALELDPDVLVRSFSGGTAAQISSPADRARYAYLLARMYGKLGDVERCIHCLQRAKEEGYGKIQDASKDPDFASVRRDPRFTEFLESKPAPQ
jgi:tetratricopeptide (TPR) repeat protein